MLSTPKDLVVRTIKRDTPATTTIIPEYLETEKYSKKRFNLPIFTNSVDLTFESQKIQIQVKLRINADYFSTEENKIKYLFSRTLGNA